MYSCSGFSSLNKVLQEALLQTKMACAFTCKLLSISIRRGEGMFKVGLIMEKLEGDLAEDIDRRASQKCPYTETELRYILECIAEALFYGKLMVCTKQRVAHQDIKPANIFKYKDLYKLYRIQLSLLRSISKAGVYTEKIVKYT